MPARGVKSYGNMRQEASRPDSSTIHNYLPGCTKLINPEPKKLVGQTPGASKFYHWPKGKSCPC